MIDEIKALVGISAVVAHLMARAFYSETLFYLAGLCRASAKAIHLFQKTSCDMRKIIISDDTASRDDLEQRTQDICCTIS